MKRLGQRGFTMLEVLVTVTICGVSTLETTAYIVKAFEFQCFYPHYRIYSDREFGIRRQFVEHLDVAVMFNLV